MDPIVPCLWFNDTAEQAVVLYTSLFPNSKRGGTSYYGPNAPMPEGTVLTCTFFLDGQEFMALNGGPTFQFTPAISMVKRCDTQLEIDRYWDGLIAGGGQPSRCGWLTDPFGVSWQIVPRVLGQMMSDPDRAKTNRVMQAFMPMTKLDLSVLERAYQG